MFNNRLMLVPIALAIVMLVGCKQPIGVPSEVRAATTHTVYCTTNAIMDPTGHIDLWQYGPLSSQVYLDWDTATITRAYYPHNMTPEWPSPRKIGVCLFKIPPFECPNGIPACTLYYYQESHRGDADLLVNAWWRNQQWPPQPADLYAMYWTIWNSTDTVATDVTHDDGDWYQVPLTTEACGAIADSGATGDTTVYFTGWVYYDSGDTTYTDVSGDDANPPYIKVVYDD